MFTEPFLKGVEITWVHDERNTLYRVVKGCSHSQLTYLYMSGNDVADIPDGTFDSLVQLEKLDLSGNKIETLHRTAFSKTAKLKVCTTFIAKCTNVAVVLSIYCQHE